MAIKKKIAAYFRVDKELVIVFLLVAITGFIFFFVSDQRAFLNFFYLPVIIGAFYFGKRYATLAATFSVLLISLVSLGYPDNFLIVSKDPLLKWLDIGTWGGFLIITGYCIGHLYDRKEQALQEIKKTYSGIMEMLSLIIDSVDHETQSHSNRVSTIAVMIARAMKRHNAEIENIRAAALLHDLGKLGVSNEVLQKIGGLTEDERRQIQTHTMRGAELIEPVGGKVKQILPYIIYHHEQFDGTGYHKLAGEEIPLGARIITVADVYDALMSDRPYRKGVSPAEARSHIMENAGKHFDPNVVDAFIAILPQLETLTLHRI
ncbi:MAG TPA: HD domain-containing phosphohydrolase [Dissulfurispiraceae bacterium]|nr:HD domain-containing phosphohydrolase [Dissulfurispiraceae bacterium]